MTTTTYDPILEITEPRRLRLLGTPSPGIGTALVLERAVGDPIVVLPGEPVPDRRTGNYRRMFLVDMSQYGLRLATELPSADPSFQFIAHVTFSCRVVDPVPIATNGVRDMTAAVRSSVVRVMRRVAKFHDILDPGGAETEMNAALDRFRGSGSILLSGFLVELDSGDTSEIHRVRQDIRIATMRRDDMRTVVKGGRDELAAQLLAKSDGDPSELIGHDAATKAMEQEQLLEALRIMSLSGETEAFSARKERDRIFERFIGSPGRDPSRRLSRRSKVIGSLAADPAEPAGAAGGDKAEPAGDAHPGDRPSRLRGARPATEQPPVEPKPANEPVEDAKPRSRVRGVRDGRSSENEKG
jgi:hypothetical protein